MAPYVNDVAVRWSDQDAYGHVNHARVVTLLEDARTGMLFDAATEAGVGDFEGGLLVSALDVAYKRPITWSPSGVRVGDDRAGRARGVVPRRLPRSCCPTVTAAGTRRSPRSPRPPSSCPTTSPASGRGA